MFELHGAPQKVGVFTTAETVIANSEAMLDRIVVGVGASSTVLIYAFDRSAAGASTAGHVMKVRNGPTANYNIDIGARFDAGITIQSSALIKLTVIYKHSS